jgi:hypothetical protein
MAYAGACAFLPLAGAVGSGLPEALDDSGRGTLLLDLLEQEEETDRGNAFDISLLARCLTATGMGAPVAGHPRR